MLKISSSWCCAVLSRLWVTHITLLKNDFISPGTCVISVFQTHLSVQLLSHSPSLSLNPGFSHNALSFPLYELPVLADTARSSPVPTLVFIVLCLPSISLFTYCKECCVLMWMIQVCTFSSVVSPRRERIVALPRAVRKGHRCKLLTLIWGSHWSSCIFLS